MKTINRLSKWGFLSILALLISTTINSCKKEDVSSAELINKHNLIGKYIFQVTPTF